MNGPKAPPAPDPYRTAEAQAKFNKETAVAQYGLNATNQKTPYGDVSYRQIGSWEDGTPRFESTTTLAPDQKAIQDNLARIGVQQSGKISGLLNQPIDMSNEATEARLFDLGSKRLMPLWAREDENLETQLINRGIRPGSEAYERARTRFTEGKNDAINQLLLTGRGQAVQEALTERNQPINEISALLSGSQVSQPNFINTPQPGVAPTDFIGAQGQSLAQQNVGFQAEQQKHMGLMNGLFGLGGTAMRFGMGGTKPWIFG